MAIGGLMATGLLASSVLVEPIVADDRAQQPAEWDSARRSSGELAGRESSAAALLDLLTAHEGDIGAYRTAGRTSAHIERLAWSRTIARLAPRVAAAAGVPMNPEGLGVTLAGMPAHALSELMTPATWRHQENAELVTSLENAAAAHAEAERAAAAQLEAERLEAERLEAERLAAEQAAAAEAAQQAQLDSERIAAEQAAQAEAEAQQRRAQSAPIPAAPATTARPAPTTTAPPAPAATAAPLAPAALPAPADNREAIEAACFALINQERAAVGLAPLSFNADLRASARAQAAQIAAAGSLFHQDLQPLLAQGWRTAGENVGYGPSVDRLHAAFVASPGHYHNMVNASFTNTGVGVVVTPDGQIWIAHVFGG